MSRPRINAEARAELEAMAARLQWLADHSREVHAKGGSPREDGLRSAYEVAASDIRALLARTAEGEPERTCAHCGELAAEVCRICADPGPLP